jgi:hypothetical protein
MFKELISDIEYILNDIDDNKDKVDFIYLKNELNGVLGYLRGMQNVFDEQEKASKE